MVGGLALLALGTLHLAHKFEDGRYPSLHLVHARSVRMVVLWTRAPAALSTDPISCSRGAVDRGRASGRFSGIVSLGSIWSTASSFVQRLIACILVPAETTPTSWRAAIFTVIV